MSIKALLFVNLIDCSIPLAHCVINKIHFHVNSNEYVACLTFPVMNLLCPITLLHAVAPPVPALSPLSHSPSLPSAPPLCSISLTVRLRRQSPGFYRFVSLQDLQV